MTRGYKVFNPDFTCKGFQYEVGKTYEHTGDLGVCSSGFHFCEKLIDCYEYYSFQEENKIAEVIAHGKVLSDGKKSVTDKIEIVKEITWSECLNLVNHGKGNTGYGNTGNRNTGDRNTGYQNTGNLNTGYQNTGNRNTGYGNTGNLNTGDLNTGYGNTGYRNTGDRNTGYQNTGNLNTGYQNTGNRNTGYGNTGNLNTGDLNTGYGNTGYRNTGDRNTGNLNTGYQNTGYRNTGYRNTGYRNTGNLNTGYQNTGNWNTGYQNTGNRNTGNLNIGNLNTGDLNKTNHSTGVLCTEEQKILIFDKPSKMTLSEWRNSQFADLFCGYELNKWVCESDMTDEEKKAHPKFYVQGGYLKVFTPEEAWQNWFKTKTPEEIELLKQIPNWDTKKFEYITGLQIV